MRCLGRGIHSRARTYHPSRCAAKAGFYAGAHELEVRGQEAVLRAGGYDAALELLGEPTSQLPAPVDPLAPTMSDEDVAALDAEIDQALESIGRSAPRR